MKDKNLKTIVEFVEPYEDYKKGEVHSISLRLYEKIKSKCRIIWRTK